MSHVDPNPFASPAIPPPVASAMPAGYPTRIEYMRSYNYIFENPNWAMNVLWGFLCILSSAVIPILGQLVFMGYQYELIHVLLTNGGRRYPDFDLNRFGDYLGRAIWPFLVGLVLVIPMVIVMYGSLIAVGIAAGVIGAAAGDDVGAVLAILVGTVGFLLVMAVWLLAIGLVTPMVLRAGLQQDFAAGFDMGWAIDFLKKTWVELILSSLFVGLTGLLLMSVGFFVFCIGAYAGVSLMMFAQSHLWYQLYLIYLGRGGKPIPVKIAPAPPLAPQPQY
jgi:hypothetical protein